MTTGDQNKDECNRILARLLDSARGYEIAAAHLGTAPVAERFRARACARRAFATNIRHTFSEDGVEYEDDGAVLEWTPSRYATIAQHLSYDTEAVRRQILTCESWLLSAYEDVKGNCSENARDVMRSQVLAIQDDIEQTKVDDGLRCRVGED